MDIEKLDRGDRYAQLLALEIWGAVQSRGFTMSALAEKLGTKQPTLSRYFNLHREIPVSTASDICEIIQVDMGLIADRAYDRLLDELGAYEEVFEAEVVDFVPKKSRDVSSDDIQSLDFSKAAAAKHKYGPKDQLRGETGAD